MKKSPLIVLLIGLAALSAVTWYANTRAATSPSLPGQHALITKTLNGKTLQMEVVSTEADVQEGLSDRPSMPMDQGMLFMFAKAERYSFWMPRMHFPLDIIWIQDGRVVDIAKNMPAPSRFDLAPATYTPTAAADRVLEVNAGQAEAYGLTIGATVPIE